ncbi:MAG: cytochrome c3 family protein [Elusimicrobia bacterium]|nr:cytochrome c3 family protein [Elusimicrobiota bacterium]
MSRAALLLLLGCLLPHPARAEGKNQCIVCHAALEAKHKAVLRSFQQDIHNQKGLSCHSCHGGDPSKADMGEAMSPEAGFVGAPKPAEVPAFCGKCHSQARLMKRYNPSVPVDQEEKYWTSRHGERLKAGDEKVATCASCHTAHSILPPKDPRSTVYAKNVPATCGACHSDAKRMKGYGLPTDQAAKYSGSVHGKALLERGDSAAPACNSCHGNHGATPPGVADISLTCGQCHAGNMELFAKSPMASTWGKKRFHVCATCHGHHDISHPDTALLDGEKGVCRKCHRPGDPGSRTAEEMKGLLDGMQSAYEAADGGLKAAEAKGMDVAAGWDALQEAKQAFFQARTAVHSFRVAAVQEKVTSGLAAAQKAAETARKAVWEFSRRRIGLGVATLLITFLVVVLCLKIRDLES